VTPEPCPAAYAVGEKRVRCQRPLNGGPSWRQEHTVHVWERRRRDGVVLRITWRTDGGRVLAGTPAVAAEQRRES
jgi:hypothetical protein